MHSGLTDQSCDFVVDSSVGPQELVAVRLEVPDTVELTDTADSSGSELFEARNNPAEVALVVRIALHRRTVTRSASTVRHRSKIQRPGRQPD